MTKKCVIPNSFRNLGFGNDNKSIAFVLGLGRRSFEMQKEAQILGEIAFLKL